MQKTIRQWIDTVALAEAMIPAGMLAPRYFHGTKKQYVQGIIMHGLYPPDFVAFGTKNSAMRPVAGRVYLSPNAKEAAMYGRYLVVINRDSLLAADMQPDEDTVGEIYYWIMQKNFTDLESTRRIHWDSPDFIARMELLNAPEQRTNVLRFRDFMSAALTANMRHQVVVNGEYAWWSKAGKAALKKMPPYIMQWLISIGVHVGHAGPIIPDEMWEIQQKGLLPDGSNLGEVARQLDYAKAAITPMPAKGPPQRFLATFRYISNYPHFGGVLGPRPATLPPPKYKSRQVTFTAPSPEEAQAEAELYMEQTVRSAEYTLLSLEKMD